MNCSFLSLKLIKGIDITSFHFEYVILVTFFLKLTFTAFKFIDVTKIAKIKMWKKYSTHSISQR